MNAKPSNCILTKLDRQQMQGNDVMSLLYFDIILYHLRTKRATGSRLRDCTTVLPRENEKQRNETVKRIGGVPYWLLSHCSEMVLNV